MVDVRDTSEDYDDLVGYKAKENIKIDLATFLDEETDDKPKVPPRKIDPDFPEEWQNLYVNFTDQETFVKFMALIGEPPAPKTKKVVFSKNRDNGILGFFDNA